MEDTRKTERLINALRATREQLLAAIGDRDRAWLALSRIATVNHLKENDLRRLARQACPRDPWDVRIELEPRSLKMSAQPGDRGR
jgi:hypothetical protein